MKKIICILCIMIFVIGLIGCGSKNTKDSLVGKWEEKEGRTIMELTDDGKILDSGDELGTYEIIEEEKVKITTQGQAVEISYELDGDTLKWGTNFESYQEFKKMKDEK